MNAQINTNSIYNNDNLRPCHWSDEVTGTDQVLVLISPWDEEYWKVDTKLKQGVPDAHLSLLYRIENRSLWSYYCLHKERFTKNSIEHNEVDVWHGTSNIDPSVIYNDPLDGFMMQYARENGRYGRGIYFAEKSRYSHSYSFQSSVVQQQQQHKDSRMDRPVLRHSEHEMFIVKLLVGESITLTSIDKTLVVPPKMNHPGNRRYNTVTGYDSGGTRLYVVYENGRAYPSYLVRYYKGNRDRERTPYANQHEALSAKSLYANKVIMCPSHHQTQYVIHYTNHICSVCRRLIPSGTAMSWCSTCHWDACSICHESRTPQANAAATGTASTAKIKWEFMGNNGWMTYNDNHQTIIEMAYHRGEKQVIIETKQWKYMVCLIFMYQMNIVQKKHRIRVVRRRLSYSK